MKALWIETFLIIVILVNIFGTQGTNSSSKYTPTCCISCIQNKYMDKHNYKQGINVPPWYKYIKHTVYLYLNKMNLLDVIYTFNKKSLLYNGCIMPNVQFLPKYPCGNVRSEIYTKGTYQWTISVHKYFSINITIWKAFVRYSDYCNTDRIILFEGNEVKEINKVGEFCGHVLLEPLYTKGNTGILLLHCINTLHGVKIDSSYEIIEKFSAYRYNGSSFTECYRIWNITTTRSPLWVYFMTRLVDYMWHYSSPSYDSHHRTSVIGNQLNIRYPSVYVVIVKLNCRDKKTNLRISPGLLPYIWSTLQHINTYCNATDHLIPFVNHRYMTLLFRINPFDTALVFNMKFQVKLNQDGKNLTTLSPLYSPTSNIHKRHDLVHPFPMLTIFGHIMPTEAHSFRHSFQFNKFNYEGFYRNLPEDHVYEIDAMNVQRKFPTGLLT